MSSLSDTRTPAGPLAGPRPGPLRLTPQRERLLLAGVLIATGVVYLRSLSNEFILDDRKLIVLNPYITQWSFLWKSLTRHEYWFADPGNRLRIARYRPVLLVWVGLLYHLFGLEPAGWHLAAAISHLAGVWLVFRIAAHLTGASSAGLIAALLFGLLPGHAEAVVWPAANSESLSAVLALAAFYCYIRRPDARGGYRLLAPGLFGAAMLTHEIVAAFPGVIGLYAILLEPSADGQAAPGALGDRAGRALQRMLPFLAVLALYFAARRFALGFSMSNPDYPINSATVAQVLMTIPWVLTSYLAGIVIPQPGDLQRRVLFVTSPGSAHFYFPLSALALLGIAFVLAVRNHSGRRLYLFGVGWVAIALAPALYLFALPEDALVPDAYAYLASFGWCLLAGAWLAGLGSRGPLLRVVATAAAMTLAAAYAVALWKTQYTFHDEHTLFSKCVDEFPEAYHCHWELASQLRTQGDLAGAAQQLKAGLAYSRQSQPLYEAGTLDADLGHVKEAEAELTTSLDMMGTTAPLAGYVALAGLYEADGDRARAQATLDRAGSLPGGNGVAQMTRARLLMTEGDGAGAEKVLRALVATDPHEERAWTMLGLEMFDQNRYQEASDAFAQAAKIMPADWRPHLYAARALHLQARDADALDQCRQALAIDPGNIEAQQLKNAIGETGKH